MLTASGCGDDDNNNANEEPWRVAINNVSFPIEQKLGQTSDFKIRVSNESTKPLPNVAISIDSFYYRDEQPGEADPAKPFWIVNRGPIGGTTAFVQTWALGKLDVGASKTFVWHVTAARAGAKTVKYKVQAETEGVVDTRLPDGQAAQGTTAAVVSPKAPRATVGKDGEVINDPPYSSPQP